MPCNQNDTFAVIGTGRRHEHMEPSSVKHSKNHIISTEVVNCVHSHHYLSVSLTSPLGVHRIHRICSDVKSRDSETAALQLSNIEWEWGEWGQQELFWVWTSVAVAWQVSSCSTIVVSLSQPKHLGRLVKGRIREDINLERCSPWWGQIFHPFTQT